MVQDPVAWLGWLVGEKGSAERLGKELKHAGIGRCFLKAVFKIVPHKSRVDLGDQFLIGACSAFANQVQGAIPNKGDHRILGMEWKTKGAEACIDGVRKILSGIEEGSVKIKDKVGSRFQFVPSAEVCYLNAVDKNRKHSFGVAYHDVNHGNLALVGQELEILDRMGISGFDLGVIPDCPEDRIATFGDQLRIWQDRGYRLWLHGYRHHADSRISRSLLGRIALSLTGGEAEFAGLGEANSRELLENAIRAWDRLGIGRAEGFIPPTWHANEFLLAQSLRVGWDFHECRFGFVTRSGQRFRSFPISMAGLPSLVQVGAISLLPLLINILPGIPRLVFHPGELRGSLGIPLQRSLGNLFARSHRFIKFPP